MIGPHAIQFHRPYVVTINCVKNTLDPMITIQ